MATTLFFRGNSDAAADVTLGVRHNRLTGAAIGWLQRALATTRGSALTSAAANTVAGPTAGIEVQQSASFLYEWITPPIDQDVTIAGTITLNLWANENNMSANVAINAVIEVIRANALGTNNSNTLVEIARSTRTTELPVTTSAAQNFTVTPTSTVVNKGDRLRIRVFGDDSTANMGSGFLFTFDLAGTTGGANGDSFVTFTENFGFAAAPAGTQIFLTDTASDVSTASVDREAWTSRGGGVVNDVTNTAAGAGSGIQVTDTAGGTVVDWFTRPLQAFTLAGMVEANLRALESNAAAQASLRLEIARVDGDGTNPTVWGTWCIAPAAISDSGELGTTEAARKAWVSGDDLAISDGQRIRIRVFVDDSSGNDLVTGHTVTLFYNGTSGGASGDSWVTFDQTLTEFAATPPKRIAAMNEAKIYNPALRQATLLSRGR